MTIKRRKTWTNMKVRVIDMFFFFNTSHPLLYKKLNRLTDLCKGKISLNSLYIYQKSAKQIIANFSLGFSGKKSSKA